MRPLTLIQTLEFYDVPQIFTAIDATGTHYLCTLFDRQKEGCHYLGVQISEPRLNAFIGGQLELRSAYTHPEVENALYLVDVKQSKLIAYALHAPQELKEDMLPEAGYIYDAADITDDAEQQTDTYQLEIPANDRITFSTLISRMGWHALSLGKNIRNRVAVL